MHLAWALFDQQQLDVSGGASLEYFSIGFPFNSARERRGHKVQKMFEMSEALLLLFSTCCPLRSRAEFEWKTQLKKLNHLLRNSNSCESNRAQANAFQTRLKKIP
ncbi:hypothetical protein Ocin01_12904 [Orchesella cincta]|uniref:Uncharacterized protein n=1 Tax=Orchesella cincta TaxID=48709 RepID=A0A1D2MLH0_ORCCI|nr:hypothetical protein Ocin01_12904 [Orchesella cincta]